MKNGEDIYDNTPIGRDSDHQEDFSPFGQPIHDSGGKDSENPSLLRITQKQSNSSLHRHHLKKRKINETDDYFDRVREKFPEIAEFHKEDIDRMRYTCMEDGKVKEKDELSSDDCVENATVFQFLLYKQRVRHIIAMWRKASVKAKAAGHIIRFINDIKDKIHLLGISHNIQDHAEKLNIPWFIIPPDHKFSQVWALIIAVLLIYTATYMPYKTCFIDESTVQDDVIDWVVDVLFMCDILVNFLQATEKDDGLIVVSPKLIAQNYLTHWFAFDLISVLPFQLIEHVFKKEDGADDMSSYNQLIRLARLPRLYRMTKLMRLFKIIKSAKNNRTVQRLLKNVKLNSAIKRMIQGMITALLLTHVFACFWFLTAKFYNFSEDTWIARMNLQDSTPGDQYIWALYWATQTVTTVGYGEIPAYTNTEIIFSFIWMLVGVGFYSFIIGNFSSIISGSSQIQKSIAYRVKGLSELARKAKLPFETSKQIKQFIESNVMALFTQDEDTLLIQTLPPVLRDEILLITYGELIEHIEFFKTVTDHDFMWKLLRSLTDMKFVKGDVLYWRGDDADSMFFIMSGKVKLYVDGNPFVKYQNGASFGDQDMLLNLPRDSKAVAMTHLHLKVLSTTQFKDLSQLAQETSLRMIVEARRKRDKHSNLIKKNSKNLSRRNVVIAHQKQQVPDAIQKSVISQASSLRDLRQPMLAHKNTLTLPADPKHKLTLSQHMKNKRRGSVQIQNKNITELSTQYIELDMKKESKLRIPSARSDSEFSGAPSEFANNQGQEKLKKTDTDHNANLNSNRGEESPQKDNQEAVPQLQKTNNRSIRASIKLIRKKTIIEQRLKALSKKNSNLRRASTEEVFNTSDTNKLSLLGGTGVPILAQPAQHDVINEENESFRTLSRKSRSQKRTYHKVHLVDEQETKNKKRSGSLTVKIDVVDQSDDTESSKDSCSIQTDEEFKSITKQDQQKEASEMATRNAFLRDETSLSNSIVTYNKRSKKGKRQKAYMNAVKKRVSLSDQNLNAALQISSRVKNAQKNKQLMQLSQRIKKQTQDELGNRYNNLEPLDSKGSQDGSETEHSPEMQKKLAELKKLEEIREESELSDSDQDRSAHGKRGTLLDNVVGEVFGKDKQRLYEMFPTIAVITVPKMPIITPKGDEIILRKKYNTNMTILTEAFEQRDELYDSKWQEKASPNHKTSMHQKSSQPIEEFKMMKSQQIVIKKEKKLIFTEEVTKFDPQRDGNVPKFIPSQQASLTQSTISKMTFNPLAQSIKLEKKANDLNKFISSQTNPVEEMPMSQRSNSMLLDTERKSSRRANSVKNSSKYNSSSMAGSTSSKKYVSPSEKERMAETNLRMKNMKINSLFKSKMEQKHDFVSRSVFAKIKCASKSLSRPANSTPNFEQSQSKIDSLQSPFEILHVNKKESMKLISSKGENLYTEAVSHEVGVPSQLVSVEDTEMSEVLSENADIEHSSPLTSTETRGKEELDGKRRLEILQQLKEFIESDEMNTQRSQRGSTRVGGGNSLRELSSREPDVSSRRSGIAFIGNQSLKSIVKFNLDSGLLGLNTFEVMSMFDQVHGALSGMKRKLKKVTQNIESIEKKQTKLDQNAEKMIEKMKAFRSLKQEVKNLNNKRLGSKDSRGGRKGRQQKGQHNTSSTNLLNNSSSMLREHQNPLIDKKDKTIAVQQLDLELTRLQPSITESFDTETSAVNLLVNEAQLIKDMQQPNQRPLMSDAIESMSGQQIARFVTRNQSGGV